jgi:TPR repeat protein
MMHGCRVRYWILSIVKGFELLQAAFDKKDPYAVASFGVFYFDGEFVEKDEKRGIQLLREAVSLGYLSAQRLLDERLRLLP